MKPKVSIAVAIYNSEKYLRECIESLVNQTLQEIEIILVSDASPDNSMQIMKEYQKKYPDKVKTIELKENLRAGGARNVGIEFSQGEYLVDCACLFGKRNTDITSNIAKTQH